MAEAIFSVLKEGLSLSQAARKYDIPYPTFVLYANRVHNMLGPSADGGAGNITSHKFIDYVRALEPTGTWFFEVSNVVYVHLPAYLWALDVLGEAQLHV
jgi:hypothetical protein